MDDIGTLSFEEAYRLLQQTVEQLEQGALPLEEALVLYEQGMNLVTICAGHLDQAEVRLLQIDEALGEALGNLDEVAEPNGHPRLWPEE